MNNRNKSIFILWSGGLDSTYLLEQTLLYGNYKEVHVGYIQIDNNIEKTKMELAAIKNMLPYFNKFESFKYMGIIANVGVNIGYSPSLKQVPIWLFGIYQIAKQYDEIAIAYVLNDCAISYLNDIKNAYKSHKFLYQDVLYHKIKVAKLIFPLIKTDKQTEYNDLNKDLRDLIVWCEDPIKKKPCNKCSPCIRHNELNKKELT